MKKLHYFLAFLIIGPFCFSQEKKQLPDIPWKDIVEINNNNDYQKITKWDTDIYVSIEGKYSQEDSLTIAGILKKLDALTQTISIQFAKSDQANFIIKYLDTAIKEGNGYTTSRYGPVYKDQGYTSCELYISKIDTSDTDLDIRKSLESRIAKMLVGGYFTYPPTAGKRNSIFNPINGLSNNKIPLDNQDQAIIKEVYKIDFEKSLAKAEKQFNYVIKNIEDHKIANRDPSLWWVKNPLAVI